MHDTRLLRRAYDELAIAQLERIDDNDGVAAACVCVPGDPCPAHRAQAVMVEIYSLLTGREVVDYVATAIRLQQWIDDHECEDVAGGALDAQADAEKRMFEIREQLGDALFAAHCGLLEAWHTEKCYAGGRHKGGPCTCGLDERAAAARTALIGIGRLHP